MYSVCTVARILFTLAYYLTVISRLSRLAVTGAGWPDDCTVYIQVHTAVHLSVSQGRCQRFHGGIFSLSQGRGWNPYFVRLSLSPSPLPPRLPAATLVHGLHCCVNWTPVITLLATFAATLHDRYPALANKDHDTNRIDSGLPHLGQCRAVARRCQRCLDVPTRLLLKRCRLFSCSPMMCFCAAHRIQVPS